MATKTSTSKTTKRPSTSPEDTSGAARSQKGGKPAETLSLIDDDHKEKPKRRNGELKPASTFTPLGAKPKVAPAPKVPATPEPPKKSLDQEKAEALSLFEETERREQGRKRPRADFEAKANTGSYLPPISLLRQEDEAPAPPPAPVVAEVVEAAPAEVSAEEVGEPIDAKIIHLKPPIIVKELSEKMGLKVFLVIKDLIEFKVFAKADTAIEPEVAAKICEKHGFVFEKEKREKGAGVHKIEEKIEEPPPPPPPETEEEKDTLELRAPIITFMGHVDHGKTSLLDAVRKTTVVSGEAGGITQHIGAYSVSFDGRPITFIDTPGHAAFSEMRARGANVTDIVVLVVAADDGFKPQTVEALNHAKAAGVTIMCAINKSDLPSANPMRIKQQLQEAGLMAVEWGGETEVLEVSAKTGLGMDSFLETMSLQAEVLDLRADPKAPMRATVIESRMDPGRGPTATVIVQSGTLKVGEPFICGPFWGKVKNLINDFGQPIKAVKPGMPAEVIGFSGLPRVGDEVVEMDNERAAKRLSEERQEEIRQAKLAAPRRSTLEALFANISEGGEKKALKLVLKTDVQGSLEAITKELLAIKSDKAKVQILHSAAGPITEGDILLASASDAVVIGFNVKVENSAVATAKREGVQVKLFSIIYELFDQVKESMLGLLDPLTREKVIGHAKVKVVFKLTRGRVAGCAVIDGRIDRKGRARVIRDGQPVFDGHMDTLRRFHDEVPEVRNGLECGIRVANYHEYQEEDIIECYELEKLQQTL